MPITVSRPAVLVSKQITANNTYDPSDDNADGYSSVVVNVPSSGGSFLHGSTDPSSAQGNDSDVYLKTSNLVTQSVTFAPPTRVQVDYYMNEDSVVEFDCMLPAPSNSYDTPWGSRGTTDYFIAYDGGTLRYYFAGAGGNVGDISDYYNKRMLITVSKTRVTVVHENTTIYDVNISGGSTASTVKLGFFSLLTDNSGGDMSATRSNGTFYGCKIYESGTLVKDYVPFKDNGLFCVKESLSGQIYFPIDGTLTGTETTGDDYVIDAFVKTNSAWVPIIGAPLDDIIDE